MRQSRPEPVTQLWFFVGHKQLTLTKHRKMLAIERQQHTPGVERGGGYQRVIQTHAVRLAPVAAQQASLSRYFCVDFNQLEAAEQGVVENGQSHSWQSRCNANGKSVKRALCRVKFSTQFDRLLTPCA